MTSAPTRADAAAPLRRDRAFATGLSIAPASADASFRSYWRVTRARIARMSSWTRRPTRKTSRRGSISVRACDARACIRRRCIAVDREQGFVLMEDLGTRTLSRRIDDTTVDALYADALDALLRMQTAVDTAGLPAFDEAFVTTELELHARVVPASAISATRSAATNGMSSSSRSAR